ncbi:hypothetical protein D9M71_801430 [compost metagenome]
MLNLIWDNAPADKHEQYQQFNDNAYKAKTLGFYFDPTKVKTEIASISSTWQTFSAGLNNGNLKVDEILPKINDKFKQNGIDAVIQEVQAQYDAWRSGQ